MIVARIRLYIRAGFNPCLCFSRFFYDVNQASQRATTNWLGTAVPSSLILQEKRSLLLVVEMGCKVRQVASISLTSGGRNLRALLQPFPDKSLRASKKCLSFRELVEEPGESK